MERPRKTRKIFKKERKRGEDDLLDQTYSIFVSAWFLFVFCCLIFFFLYIYLFIIFFKSRDVFTVLIWKIRAEYRWWLTCSGDRRLCVSVRDPSEAYIRGAVMYAGRKRRKPVQRA